MPHNKDILKQEIGVKNAGLVIINAYIPLLFSRLGLTDNQKFNSIESQQAAVHYLQFILTGQEQTEESLLPLNKLLCGMQLTQPVTESISISQENKLFLEGLIKAAIGAWQAIGNTSVDGFRSNWLIRDGLLTDRGDSWELTVEKRPYDLLIQRSLFSFSVIKYPWMDKPLHVNWPY